MTAIFLLQKCFKKFEDPNCRSYYDEYISKCIDDKTVAIAFSFKAEAADDRKNDDGTDTGE